MYKQKIKILVAWAKPRAWKKGNEMGLPTSGGVYELLVLQSDRTWQRRYVGQGADTRERFLAHLSQSEPNACLKGYLRGTYEVAFRYALIPSAADRADAEQALWDKWHHKCNQARPAGSGRGYDIDLVEE